MDARQHGLWSFFFLSFLVSLFVVFAAHTLVARVSLLTDMGRKGFLPDPSGKQSPGAPFEAVAMDATWLGLVMWFFRCCLSGHRDPVEPLIGRGALIAPSGSHTHFFSQALFFLPPPLPCLRPCGQSYSQRYGTESDARQTDSFLRSRGEGGMQGARRGRNAPEATSPHPYSVLVLMKGEMLCIFYHEGVLETVPSFFRALLALAILFGE